MAIKPNALPQKIHLNGVKPESLSPEDKTKYDAYYVEKRRRKDPSLPGVAQESLDCVAWLKEQGRSPSEAFTEFGYSLRSTVKPALKEEQRIVAELAVKPSAEIVESETVAIKVVDVMAANEIPEFIPKPDPIPIPK